MAKDMDNNRKAGNDKMPTIEGDDIPNLDGLAIDDDMPIIGSDICNDTLAEGDAKRNPQTQRRGIKRSLDITSINSEKVEHSGSTKDGDLQHQL
eukprot:2216863-Ditylum_brightwellii.AAC.1